MDTGTHSDVSGARRERKLGVMGGRPCATCGIAVVWRIEQFCLGQRQRFGGRIYCRRCQAAFPEVAREVR